VYFLTYSKATHGSPVGAHDLSILGMSHRSDLWAVPTIANWLLLITDYGLLITLCSVGRKTHVRLFNGVVNVIDRDRMIPLAVGYAYGLHQLTPIG
jgi:hypothetical protein